MHDAKTDCVVIDHGGNVQRHGFFEDDPPWSLDITKREPGEHKSRPTIECPKCQAIYRGGMCRNCGYEPTRKERAGVGLEFDGSQLKEVVRGEERKTAAKTPEELMVSALYKSGRTGKTWKQCVGIYFRLCEAQGQKHRVPKEVTVGGKRYRMVERNSADDGRRVSALYPFTVSRGDHSSLYLVEPQQHGSAW